MYYDNTMYKGTYGYNSNMQGMPNMQNIPNQSVQYQNMMYFGAEDVAEELISFNEALDLIRQSIEDEREDEIFYDSIIEIAPTDAEKDIIRGIRDDEKRHNNILRYLYYNFTGMALRETRIESEESNVYTRHDNNSNTNINNKYMRLLTEAWLGEFAAVRKYRKILGAMPDQRSRTLINSILTDELIHSNKYNYLITKNK